MKIFSWLWNALKNFGRSKQAKVLEDLTELGLVVVSRVAEMTTGRDLNGDGRVDTVADILEDCRLVGTDWAKEFLTEAGRAALTHMPRHDLKRWLAVAKLATYVIARWGATKLPALHLLNAAVEMAYVMFKEGKEAGKVPG